MSPRMPVYRRFRGQKLHPRPSRRKPALKYTPVMVYALRDTSEYRSEVEVVNPGWMGMFYTTSVGVVE